MTKLVWDGVGERFYESGTSRGVLYPCDTSGAYQTGVAWNGLTSVNESPSGADPTDIWADNQKYASMRSAESFGGTIEAYTYPKEFEECDGSAELSKGVIISQQGRKAFGLCYRTEISNDVNAEHYKLHLVYNATASPSEKAYTTINDSPDALSFSWEFTATPVNVSDFKPTALLVIDSRDADADKLKQLEEILYGSESSEPKFLLPDDVKKVFDGTYPMG